MVSVIEDINEVILLRENLEKIYNTTENLCLSSPSLILSSIESFYKGGHEFSLFFVLNKNKEVIESYLPLYIDEKKTLRFIFDEHTDFCGIVGKLPDFQFFKDLAKIILNNGKIDRIHLDNLLPDSSLLNAFQHFFKPGVLCSCYNNHSFITSNKDKGFLSHLKSKEKSELKRIQKRNNAYQFKVYSGSESFPKFPLQKLRNMMIQDKIRKSDFFDHKFLEISQALYEAGELEIFTKSDEKGDFVSASLVIRKDSINLRMVWIDFYADIQYINLSAYIDYIHFLEQCNPVVFDFGRGSYDYKSKNFQPEIQNLYNLRYSKSKFDFYFINYYPVKEFFKRIVKS